MGVHVVIVSEGYGVPFILLFYLMFNDHHLSIGSFRADHSIK